MQADCWIWPYKDRNGYGRITIGSGCRVPAHRWFYEQLVGPIPDGLVIDHLCRTRNCVNPAHMEPVTIRENVMRGRTPSLIGYRAGTCGRGHAKTPENVYPRKDRPGKWNCRACARIIDARRAPRRRKEVALTAPVSGRTIDLH